MLAWKWDALPGSLLALCMITFATHLGLVVLGLLEPTGAGAILAASVMALVIVFSGAGAGIKFLLSERKTVLRLLGVVCLYCVTLGALEVALV